MKRKKTAKKSTTPFREYLLLQIFHNTPAIVWVIDPKGVLTFIEGKGLELLGLQPENLLGKSVYDLYSDRPLIEHSIQRALKGESFSIPVQLESFFFENQLMPLRDDKGRITGIIGTSIDVTSRRQALQQLNLSEDKFRNLIENSHDVINLFGPDATILYVSPSVKQVLGYLPEEIQGKSGWQFLHPNDLEQIKKAFNEIVKVPRLSDGAEARLRHKDGSWKNVEMTAINLLDDPAVKSVVCNYHDVTDRKKVEAKLLESEEKFRKIFENAPLGVGIVEKGTFMDANRSFCDMLGYERSELVGKTFLDITHPDDIEESRKKTQQLWNGKTHQFKIQKRYLHKNGSAIWANSFVTDIIGSDSGYRFTLAIIENITEKMKAEEALRASEENFRNLIEKSPDAMIVHRFDRVYYVNRAFLDLTGFSQAEDLIGRSPEFLMPPGERENIKERVQHLDRLGQYNPPVERKIIRKDGTAIPVEVVSFSIRFSGEVVAVAVMRDLAERKNTEQALLKYVRLGAIGEMASGMAHEIRNPLSGIVLSAQFLALTVGSSPEVQEQIQNILDQCERLKNLVNDTLDFSRDKATESRRKVDQKELFQTALRLAQSQYGPDSAKFKVRSAFDGLSHFLYINPFRIQQVLVNLVINAFEAMEQGGTLTLSCREQDGILRLSMQDDGGGIAEEDLPRIFEPFFTTKKGGSGLGLAVSRKIIEAQGGKILVERLEPRGTVFHLELPAWKEGAP